MPITLRRNEFTSDFFLVSNRLSISCFICHRLETRDSICSLNGKRQTDRQTDRESRMTDFPTIELPSCRDKALKKLLRWVAVWCEDFFGHLLQGHMLYWDCTHTAKIKARSLPCFPNPPESCGVILCGSHCCNAWHLFHQQTLCMAMASNVSKLASFTWRSMKTSYELHCTDLRVMPVHFCI
jgi:hypothetical protein